MIRPTHLALTALLAAQLPAQERLLQPADLDARRAAAAALEPALATDPDAAAAAAVRPALRAARDLLPAGSAAHARAAALLADDPDADGAALHRAARQLHDDLTFAPLREADLPTGFPGYSALDELELRTYPGYRMVRTDLRGGSMGAFWPLFRHIEQHAIAMTTPVQIDHAEGAYRAGEGNGGEGEGTAVQPPTMAFLYGSPDLGPLGRDGRVEVVDVPATTVLTIGSRGYDRPSRVAELRQRLDAWLALSRDWQAAGPLRVMVHNSPSVAGDRRYFEVQLPVRPTDDGAAAGHDG
ncbi:MAG: heme-binding protein [Planctomycetota bacterium]